MPVASSSLVALSYVEETNWGVTPSAPLRELRWTGESLALTTTSEVSAEVRADRQVPDVVRTGIDVQGDINVEMSFGTFDDLLEGALMSSWTPSLAISGTNLSIDASDSSINSASGGLGTIVPGQWIKVAGFSNAANNGYFQATSVTANKVLLSGGTLVNEAAGASVAVGGSSLRNGTDPKSFTIEKAFTDINEYVAFTGMRVASMNLAAETGAMITGAFSFQGKIASARGTSVGTGPVVTAPSNPVFNTVDHIQGLRIGGQAVAFDVSAHNFTIDNTLRAQKAQGSLGNIGIGLGTLNVTGSVSAYFTSRTLYEKHLNWETSSFSFRMVDGNGNGYVFTFPALKFTDGNPVAGGKDQDIIAEMAWTAFRHPTLGYTVQIDRFSV